MKPQRWAVILVGLPGDADHEAQFRETANQLSQWLTQSLVFPADHVMRLPAEATDGNQSAPAPTAESMRSLLVDVNQKLKADDALWVFTIGHGNYDGKHAWFHVAGRDPSSEDMGRWLADVRCREQVIWLTHSSSGWFVKPLARPGRIVIAATATDDESNETEFPHALATVAQWPAIKLDRDKDQSVSVAELYTAVVQEVLRRFQSDNRLPTEHAQIDDNGDGIGTEDIQTKPGDPAADSTAPPMTRVDGELARKIRIPYRESGNGDTAAKPAVSP